MKSNLEEAFIEKSKNVHNNKYDYSKVKYTKAKEKVCIICPEHGEFWQAPTNHLNGNGCPKCAELMRIEKKALKPEEFIEKASTVTNTTIQR